MSSTQNLNSIDTIKTKYCNGGYWSVSFLKKLIDTTLNEGGSLNDIFKLDVDNYKKLDGYSDRLPIKFRPVKNGPYFNFKIDSKKEKHAGQSYSKDFDSGFIKVAKYNDTSLFVKEGEVYKMRDGVEPTEKQHSATFAVIEYLQQFCEAEIDALKEQGIIALPQKKSKEKNTGAKIILRSKNDSLNVPISYEHKKTGKEIVNPTAMFKFQKDKESGDESYRLSTCNDVSPDATETEIRLSGKNISNLIVPQTTIRVLCSLQAINIYEQGISIASYVDSIQFSRPEKRTQASMSLDCDSDSEKDDGDGEADVDF